MRFFIILASVFLTVTFFGGARAQSPSETGHSQTYNEISYPSLMGLLWRYQIYDTDDNVAVDDYLKISNCGLYDRYFSNDFLWGNIRESFKRELTYYSGEFPHRFEIKTAIPLGRYDFNRAVFMIDDAFKMDNAGAIEIPLDAEKISCGSSPLFPTVIKFSADNKFSLHDVPVPVDLAEILLKKIKKYRYEGIDSKHNRTLAVRFRIAINDVKFLRKSDGTRSGIVYQGQLDEIAFFADPEMTDLVWRKPFVELGVE